MPQLCPYCKSQPELRVDRRTRYSCSDCGINAPGADDEPNALVAWDTFVRELNRIRGPHLGTADEIETLD